MHGDAWRHIQIDHCSNYAKPLPPLMIAGQTVEGNHHGYFQGSLITIRHKDRRDMRRALKTSIRFTHACVCACVCVCVCVCVIKV